MRSILFLLLAMATVAATAANGSVSAGSGGTARDLLQAAQQRDQAAWRDREKALTLLLEGQRHFRSMVRSRSRSAIAASAASAKKVLYAALDLDPSLAEAYTILAEISLRTSPDDLDGALVLAGKALEIDKKNFGASRLRAQIFTIKSGVADGVREGESHTRATESWMALTVLDPRNAEAWAFLSEFHRLSGRTNERIEALRKWLASATPSDPGFFRSVFGMSGDLSPEVAAIPLGDALLEEGRPAEALVVLNNAVADEPENEEAVRLLKQTVALIDARGAQSAGPSLEQVIFANPSNGVAIELLARIRARAGRLDDGLRLLTEASDRLRESEPDVSANLLTAKADLLVEEGRTDEGLAIYDEVLTLRGLIGKQPLSDFETDLEAEVIRAKLRALKLADRFGDAGRLLAEGRKRHGQSDLFWIREELELLRETGKREQALGILKAVRLRYADDIGLLRLQANLLVETGKLEEAVALIKPLLGKPSGLSDDFSNHLFISTLYASARRGIPAVDSARAALSLARSDEQRQIADLAVAYAHQRAGESAAAEEVLRRILRLNRSNPFAQNNLGFLLVSERRGLDEAVSLIFRALKVDPENPSYIDSLGWALAAKGDLEAAYDHLKRALRLNPTSAVTLSHLADVAEKMGRTADATAFRKRALRLTADAKLADDLNRKIRSGGGK